MPVTTPPAEPPARAAHPLDRVSLGRIVQIREQLMAAQAAGARVYRFESGDPSFTPPAHVVDAVVAAARAGKTHYVPNDGIPELRRALARKAAERNGIAGVTPDDVFVTNGAMHALFAVFGALLAPGDAFGDSCADAIRFSFSCDEVMVAEGSRALRDALL